MSRTRVPSEAHYEELASYSRAIAAGSPAPAREPETHTAASAADTAPHADAASAAAVSPETGRRGKWLKRLLLGGGLVAATAAACFHPEVQKRGNEARQKVDMILKNQALITSLTGYKGKLETDLRAAEQRVATAERSLAQETSRREGVEASVTSATKVVQDTAVAAVQSAGLAESARQTALQEKANAVKERDEIKSKLQIDSAELERAKESAARLQAQVAQLGSESDAATRSASSAGAEVARLRSQTDAQAAGIAALTTSLYATEERIKVYEKYLRSIGEDPTSMK